MFMRNVDKLSSDINLYYCQSQKEKNYLESKDIFPISSTEKNNMTVWVFVQCKELKNVLKQKK